MNKTLTKKDMRARRHRRIRAKITGTALVPRLCVFKSNKFIYAQLIDDESGKTIVESNSMKLKGKPVEQAKAVGADLAKKAQAKKVSKVVFDRSGYVYTGKVQAIAEGAREGGLVF